MGLFSSHKVHPILRHVDSTTILGAEVQNGKLTKLCYTGRGSEISDKGVVQAIVPGGDLLWRADLAHEDDVEDGHVAVADGVVVTRIEQRGGHVVIGHGLWTGEEKWRLPVAKMVTRMGIDGAGRLVFVTFDHAVHVITIATGVAEPHPPVMTDQASQRVIDATRHPTQTFSQGSGSGAPADWSAVYRPAEGLEVYERDWAGTREFGVGQAPSVHLLGSGSYEGALYTGDVVVLGFKLDRDGTRHHHWYLYSQRPSLLLAILREDGKSELYENGHSVWQGKL